MRLRKLFACCLSTALLAALIPVPASAASAGTLTLDTRSYTMAPGDIYDFRAKVEGGDLRQSEVAVSDSRTGSVVKLSRVPNTDKYRITAVREGTCYVVAEIRGAHASIKVEVKKGAKQGGEAARSVTVVDAAKHGNITVTPFQLIDPDKVEDITSQPERSEPPPAVTAGINKEYSKEIWRLTNREREKAGLHSLDWNETLAEIAELRAEEITEKFSHTRPNGKDVLIDFHEEGCHGENIASVIAIENAITRWMESKGHRQAILAESFNSMAVGCYVKENGMICCVQIFSRDEVS